MRKVNQASVRAEFRSNVDELMAYMNRTRHALEAEPHQKRDVSRLASTTFLSLYVSFERFLSDLFLAYLNRNFSRYQAFLENRLKQSVKSNFGTWAESRTRFDGVEHVRLAELESIVDPNRWNLTFPDAATIKARADDWLTPPHARRINSLTRYDERLIDTARATRDFIAHRSPGAKARMNAALATVAHGSHNRYLDRGQNDIHNVGSYLKAVFEDRRRIAIYAERFKEIAAKM